MGISRVRIAVTTNAWGGGTAYSQAISGEVLSVRIPATSVALTGTGGTCQLKLTRDYDGGTIMSGTVGAAPLQYQPREAVHTTALGTTAYSTGVGPVVSQGIPVLGTVTAVVTTGANSQAGTVEILYRR